METMDMEDRAVLRRRSSVEGGDTAQEDRSGARGPSCAVLDEEGILWRESRSSVTDDAVKSVRGLAPETQVGLSGYSVTIKLCDSYCLGIGLDELRRLATIKLRDDSGWRLWSGVSVDGDEIDGVGDKVEWMRIHSTFGDEKNTFFIEYCAGGPSSATPVLLSCVASFDTAPPPQDLLAGLLYTAPPPSTGDGSFDSCLSNP
ncbi:uncharacterized protein UHOD_11552 [Ustilago sp. UG-2017b]|nr:uncharacterized protein UHOD_11552 [Ustilago sp. UG-2017b]